MAIVSIANGSYHKLRSQSTQAYQFDYQMKPWNYNWNNQDKRQTPKSLKTPSQKTTFWSASSRDQQMHSQNAAAGSNRRQKTPPAERRLVGSGHGISLFRKLWL